MRPDLAQILLVPVEHRTSIVYATHDKWEHASSCSRNPTPTHQNAFSALPLRSLRLCVEQHLSNPRYSPSPGVCPAGIRGYAPPSPKRSCTTRQPLAPVGYDRSVGPQLPQVSFEIVADCPHTRARAGLLHTPHGTIETPAFMPVGTQATVKGLPQRDLAEDLGVGILLANTYHLYLRPGHELIRQMGGLHQFMSWPNAILTDSGGFQVFSLSGLRQIDEAGVV